MNFCRCCIGAIHNSTVFRLIREKKYRQVYKVDVIESKFLEVQYPDLEKLILGQSQID